MRSILLSLLTVMSCQALAHIEKGVWRGQVSDAANCFMEVGDTTFIDGIKNPLNERIAITIGQTLFSVKHPYTADFTTGTISFNHDIFEDVVATPTGAFAVKIKMSKDPQKPGPESLSVMEHDWKSGFKEVLTCSNFEYFD